MSAAEDQPAATASFTGVDERTDWKSIGETLFKHRWPIATIVGLALGAAIAVLALTTPIYRAETTIRIEQLSSRVLGTEDADPPASLLDVDRYLETQLDLMRSRTLADRVGRTLRLFEDDGFLDAMKARRANDRRSDVMDSLTSHMAVTLPRNSRVARIHFDSPDPALAAKVANSFAVNFVAIDTQRKLETSARARNFVSARLEEARGRLEQSERAMIAYARQARLIDTSSGLADQSNAPRSLTAAALVQINSAAAAATASRIATQERWEQTQRRPPISLPEVLANPAVQQLVQQRAEQQASYEQDRQRRREAFPAMQQARASIMELDRQIETLSANIKSNIRGEYDVALRQEKALSRNLARLRVAALAEQERSVRYGILKREAETNREIYEALLQRYREVAAAADIPADSVTIIDPATIPVRPVSPRPLPTLLLALIAGLALALFMVFVKERSANGLALHPNP